MELRLSSLGVNPEIWRILDRGGSLSFSQAVSLFISSFGQGEVVYLPLGNLLKRSIVEALNARITALGGVELELPLVATASQLSWSKRAAMGYFRRTAERLEGEPARYLMPTHEELMVSLFGETKQLPRDQIWFQVGKKFRKGEEFSFPVRLSELIMHDTYTFSASESSMLERFDAVLKAAVCAINDIGIQCYLGAMETGKIFGDESVEILSQVRGIDDPQTRELELGHAYQLFRSYESMLSAGQGPVLYLTGTGIGVDRLVYAVLAHAWKGKSFDFAEAVDPFPCHDGAPRGVLRVTSVVNDISLPEAALLRFVRQFGITPVDDRALGEMVRRPWCKLDAGE